MGLKFWYVVEGHHIFQIRQFLLKRNLDLVKYKDFRFQLQFEQLE